MPADLPIACSLNARELPERLRQMADLGRDALLDTRIENGCAQLRFAAGAGVRARVDVIVAAESECCAFLAMRVSDEPDAIVLTIQAPNDAAPMLVQLVDAFGATDS
jgi:hypothetical protein